MGEVAFRGRGELVDEGKSAAAEAGRSILVLNRDLIFGSRIAAAARSLGLDCRFARDLSALADAVSAADGHPDLVVVDMNAPLDWPRLAEIVAGVGKSVPFLGFGPHVDIEGRRAAKGAGLTRIVSNGEMHRDTVGLIDRYRRKRANG